MLGPAASGSHQQHSKRPWHKGIQRQEPLVWDGASRITLGKSYTALALLVRVGPHSTRPSLVFCILSSWVGVGVGSHPVFPSTFFKYFPPLLSQEGSFQLRRSLTFELLREPDSRGLGWGGWDILLEQSLQAGVRHILGHKSENARGGFLCGTLY